jgi:hypothetical protein
MGAANKNDIDPKYGPIMNLKNAKDSFIEAFYQHYSNDVPFPDEFIHAIPVNAGDWIGQIGVRGIAGRPHTHLEVFEYFPQDQASVDDINKYGKWKRIDPKSLWSPLQYQAISPDAHNLMIEKVRNKYDDNGVQKIFVKPSW